ncbi:MAG: acetyl-CoA carboxylase biotin carboxyl carrier protein [Rubricoccaceae bacterium]|nr:acetyl-CoA carboxylase biotin carboxyl carrier protein [Rubricoccaceae bacterium]
MDLEKIERLLDIIAKSGMAEVEVEEDEFRLVVRAAAPSATAAPTVMAMPQPVPIPLPAYGGGYPALPPTPAQGAPSAPEPAPAPAAPQPAPSAAPEPAASADGVADGVVVQAPIVGTFYRAPAPDADPFVKVGDTVAPGDVLCIIEAMKLMNEIQSEHAGTVRQILVENAEPVEYDQPLFVIDEG